MMNFIAWWHWVLFRLFGKVFVLFVFIGGGVNGIVHGRRMLDLSNFHIVAEPGYLRIDGGVGELGMGILFLLIGLLLCWRWVRARGREVTVERSTEFCRSCASLAQIGACCDACISSWQCAPEGANHQ
jgi:hypothetical protein